MNLERRHGQEQARLILEGYAGIALVHRFGFWLSRRLLARYVSLPESELAPRLLRPLKGELLEAIETDDRRFYTRHPWIAEHALQHLVEQVLVPPAQDLYQKLFVALGTLCQQDARAQERKLLTLLPLAFKRQGELKMAHDLFARAAEADPRHAPTLQAWALLEKEQGRVEEARALLERGLQQVTARRGRAILLSTLGGFLAEQGDLATAERHFQEALRLDEKDPLAHYHFAMRVLLPAGRREEACRHLARAHALRARKPRDRERIEQALRRHSPADTSS